MDSFEDGPDNTNWCVGGCQHFRETEAGRERFRQLTVRNLQEKEAGRPHVPFGGKHDKEQESQDATSGQAVGADA